MQIDHPLALLGGLSPERFMRRHWQKKPLLIRQAIPGFTAPIPRPELFALAEREDVESRVIERLPNEGWGLKRGPFRRRSLPAFRRPDWTLLVQGVDLHDVRAERLLQQFRFVPDARLDDLMISWASDGGGVGPHFDSYDVFLLQAQGRRRWRIGRMPHAELRDDVPTKILKSFEPEEEYVLEPGDMLYLPPRWAHDGTAEGECMTYSVGFRAPRRDELAREVALRALEDLPDDSPIYADPGQPATATPGLLSDHLVTYAMEAVHRALSSERDLRRAVGEYLSDPKPGVWFDRCDGDEAPLGKLRLDPGTRLLYDAHYCYINGESFRMSGRDAALMRSLANDRQLSEKEVARASTAARELLTQWREDGWLRDDHDE